MSTVLTQEAINDLEYHASKSPPKGCFVEIGVYKGGSALILYKICEQQCRQLFLYDTFEGLPFKDEENGDLLNVGMFNDTSKEIVKQLIPYAVIIKGLFPDSLIDMPPISFVHADADQYKSTLDICTILPPLMLSGGMILFDDYSVVECGGCKKAVNDTFKDKVIITKTGRALVII